MKTLTYTKTFENKGELTNIFIPTNREWKSTENDNLSVIESGENGILFKKIIEDIKNAKEMVCLQSFLIQDTEIIDELIKAKEQKGVRIFVLDSAEAKLEAKEFEGDESFSTKEYKQMLNEKFKNNFVHRQAGNLHSKFILIDPKTNDAKGYLFTGNFNEKPFFENPELAVELGVGQIQDFFKVFVYHFWKYTTHEQTANEQFDKVNSVGKFDSPKLTQILVTSPDNELSNLKNVLIQAVKKAQNRIIFSTFGFDITNELSQNILAKLLEGVEVIVFCRPREKAIKGNIEELAKNGAKVICHPLIHAKSLLIDEKEAYIFTANFESHGMDTGFETGVKLDEKQIIDLQTIYKKWEETFPFIYAHKKAIQEIDKYVGIEDTRNVKVLETEKEEKISEKIKDIKSLIHVLENINEPKNYKSKKYIVNINVQLDSLSRYKNLKNLESETAENIREITNEIKEITFEKKNKITNKKTKKVEEKIETYKVIILNSINDEVLNCLKDFDKSLKILTE